MTLFESFGAAFILLAIGFGIAANNAKKALDNNPRARQAAASGAFWLLGKLLGRK